MVLKIDKSEKFLLHNSDLIQTSESEIEIPDENKVFYEVIRVINGKPLFLEEHLERLLKSTQLSGVKCICYEDIIRGINILLSSNPVLEKNLKITFYCNKDKEFKPELFAYFVESHYPSSLAYKQGVKVELLPIKRENPNIKLENPILRGSADKVICLSQTHEVLLVNDSGFITEGSRSNFFAVINGKVVTPPSKDVLEGITRKVVIRLLQKSTIDFVERPIHSSEIDNMEGAFITGTSSKVLPIIKIGDTTFKSIVPSIRMIMELFDEEVNKNL